MQISKTPQITFGIKHSPLLGQLKPISPTPAQNVNNQDIKNVTTNTQSTKIVTTNGVEYTDRQNNVNEVNNVTQSSRTHITKIKTVDNDIRNCSESPEPIQETLTQELVWVPETRVRRGSYTIEKSDGSAFIDNFNNNEVIPVENGVIHKHESGIRTAACTNEQSRNIVKHHGMEQIVDKNVQSATAHEKNQTSSEENRTASETHDIPGGKVTTTTTTKIRKVGTATRNAAATTTSTRSATTITSRDIGTK